MRLPIIWFDTNTSTRLNWKYSKCFYNYMNIFICLLQKYIMPLKIAFMKIEFSQKRFSFLRQTPTPIYYFHCNISSVTKKIIPPFKACLSYYILIFFFCLRNILIVLGGKSKKKLLSFVQLSFIRLVIILR